MGTSRTKVMNRRIVLTGMGTNHLLLGDCYTPQCELCRPVRDVKGRTPALVILRPEAERVWRLNRARLLTLWTKMCDDADAPSMPCFAQ
jgi:hypothetical protein